MKRLILSSIIVSIVFIGCDSPFEFTAGSTSPSTGFSVRLPTIEEEADTIIGMIQNYDYFRKEGYYDFKLPGYPIVDSLYKKVSEGGTISPSDRDELISVVGSYYSELNYSELYTKINSIIETANTRYHIFERYNKKWGFYIPKNGFVVTMSIYSDYSTVSGNSAIIIGYPRKYDTPNVILHIIFHEAFHIGYMNSPETIVLSYWQNERLTDLFVNHHFTSVTQISMYQSNDSSIDRIFEGQNKQEVWDDLPNRIRQFLGR